ncbi:hypothetical protein [Pseudomonas lundensis]|uniref:hypothetical protein n=1 Tax=Pseudomonas lundensis TaxID=86185 RepID=UPI0018918D46|nr:hypothetical protein [Pseudomonas lundensis]QOF92740.1 hypothetical protein IF654_06190 [Pseudomonas lundensis]
MRTEEHVETSVAKVVRGDEPRGSVIFSDAFAERRKQKEYQHAVSQIAERAKKLEW